MEPSGPLKMTGAAEIDRAVVRFVPWRWADARERLLLLGGEALQDRKALAGAAERLGLSTERVQDIARALAEQPVDQAMAGWLSRVPRSSDRLDPRVVGIIGEVLASHGDPVIRASEVVRGIEGRCARAGLTPPSRATIVRHLARHRDALHGAEEARTGRRPFDALAIDRVVPNVPIEGVDGRPTLARIVVVTDEGTGTILHAAAAHHGDWPMQAVTALADGLDAARATGMRRPPASVHLERSHTIVEWSRLVDALGRSGVSPILSRVRTPATGRLHVRCAGRSLAGATVLAAPLLGPGGPERRAATAARIAMTPLDHVEAARMIGAAVEVHNEKRLTTIERHLDREHGLSDDGDAERLRDCIARLRSLIDA